MIVIVGMGVVSGGRIIDDVGIGCMVIRCGVECQTIAAIAVLELELEVVAEMLPPPRLTEEP